MPTAKPNAGRFPDEAVPTTLEQPQIRLPQPDRKAAAPAHETGAIFSRPDDSIRSESAPDPDLREFRVHPEGWAVFLDIDGTLIDIAPTPDDVTVPAGLADDLDRLRRRLGGALGLITGRAVAFVDRLFAPYRFAVAGLHGAEWRLPGARPVGPAPDPDFECVKRFVAGEAARLGVLFEDKGAAVAVHYRQSPKSAGIVRDLMERAVDMAGVAYALQTGKMVIELRPEASKGEALVRFMEGEVFRGRRPIVFGDDDTDETMFETANRLGGLSVRIGEDRCATSATNRLATPAMVRSLIGSAIA